MTPRLFVVALALTPTLPACGHSNSARPLGERGYRSAVDRVCARTHTAYNRINSSEAKIETVTVGRLATRADAVSGLYRAQLPLLRRLIVPKRIARRVADEIALMRRLSRDYSREAAQLRARPDQQRELSGDELTGLSYFATNQTGYVRWVAYLNLDPYCWPAVVG
jgi:hypothetical protein